MMANIQSLPNELVEDILDIACGDQLPTPLWQQLQLSHVNQRFREITTNNAHLWSHITFRSTVEWVELLLRRSGSCGLTIDMSDHHHCARRCSCPDMVSRVIEHKDRWKEVRVGAGFNDEDHKIILSLLKNIALPSLLRLIFPEDKISYHRDGRLCLSWKMPSLEHLTCSDDVYRVPFELPVPLKSLRHTEYSDWTADVIILHNLMNTKSVVGVEELTMRFKLPLMPSAHVVYNTVRMENLRTFTVEFLTITPREEARKFFEYLDLPALEVFKFKHDRPITTGDSPDEDILQPYLHCLNWLLVDYHSTQTKFPKLRDVQVTINGIDNKDMCTKLRGKLDEKFRNAWFGGNLAIAGEEEFAEVVASASRVHIRIHPTVGLVRSQ